MLHLLGCSVPRTVILVELGAHGLFPAEDRVVLSFTDGLLLVHDHGRHVGLATLRCFLHSFVVAGSHFLLLAGALSETLGHIQILLLLQLVAWYFLRNYLVFGNVLVLMRR